MNGTRAGRLVLALLAALATSAGGATLRIGSPLALETLDPMRADSMWAQAQAGTLFDQLYAYDYLANPAKLIPLAAEGLPVVSDGGLGITVRIRPGIRFTPHPAFRGDARELTADDFVYSVKRLMDPGFRSVSAGLVAGRIEGLDEWARQAPPRASREHFDAPVAGLVAVDRFVVRLRLTRPDPTFVFLLASPVLSIVPREAVEADGIAFSQRPTGSGPYVMREMRPGSRLVLERNPSYRDARWGDFAAPQPTEPEWAAALRDRRFPLPDRVEVVHLAEPSAGLLALEKGQIDVWPAAGAGAIVEGRLAPRLEKAGIQLAQGREASAAYLRFNLRDARLGGTSVERVALRRAIAMAIDDAEYIRVIGQGRGRAAQHPIPHGISGHDPDYRNPNAFDLRTANALLDHVGYRKGSDGYRLDPAGRELVLSMIVSTNSEGRRWAEFMKRSLDRLGVRMSFEPLPTSEHFKRIVACRFQLMRMDWRFDWPDGSNLMLAFRGTAPGSSVPSCTEDAEFDRLFEELGATPLGPAREALIRRMVDRLDALMPGRLLPAGELPLLIRPGVRGWLVHPAILAPFPFVDVAK